MKLLVCLLSLFVLSQCALHSILSDYTNQILSKDEGLSQKRQTGSSICPLITCLNVGQACKSNPYDGAVCQPCIDAVSVCLGAAAGNQTLSCACLHTASNCFVSKGGVCLLYPSSFQSTCVSVGGPNCNCTAPNIPNYPISQCKTNYNCLNNTVCSVKPTFNESCSTLEQNTCADNVLSFNYGAYTCSNSTKRCVRTRASVSIGDPCSTASECKGAQFSPQRTTCTGGVCVGVAANGACNATEECAFGLYCKAFSCKAQLAAGANCSIFDDTPCSGVLTCGAEGTCIPPYSKAIGSSCVTVAMNGMGSNECVLGSTCSPSTKKCRGPYAFNTCNPALNNTGCEADTACQCSTSGDTKCIPDMLDLTPYISPSCKAPFDALATCMSNAQCNGDLTTPNGCAVRNCNNQIQCLLQCYVPSFNTFPGFAGCIDVPTNFNCVGGPTSAGVSTNAGTNSGTNAGTNSGTNAGTNAGSSGSNFGTNTDTNGGSNSTTPMTSSPTSSSSTLVVITWFATLLLLVTF